MQARALVEQGRLQRNGGDLAEAERSYTRAAELWRGVDAAKYAHALRHVADIARENGRLDVAEAGIAEVVALYRVQPPAGLNGLLEMGNALRVYALITEQQGNREHARKLWEEVAPLYRAVGVKESIEEAEAHLTQL